MINLNTCNVLALSCYCSALDTIHLIVLTFSSVTAEKMLLGAPIIPGGI